MIELIAAIGLATVVVVMAWPWRHQISAGTAAFLHQHGVFLGAPMMLFPTAEERPARALKMTLYGVEVKDLFVGVVHTKTLVKQNVTPARPQLILPE